MQSAGGSVHVRAYTRFVNGKVYQVQAYDRTAPWRGRANSEFREWIARAERSHAKANFGYGDRGRDTLGRYQIKFKTLSQIRWRNPEGTWTDKVHAHGVSSDDDFLKNPAAQESAMDDLLRNDEEEARRRGLFERVGQTFHGLKSDITVTEAGIMAAVHRAGAKDTALFFERLDRSGGYSERIDDRGRLDRPIEARLREFQRVRYRRIGRR